MMPRVLNFYRDKIPPNSVYIGRPSRWGNPFILGKDGDREEVLEKYKNWVYNQEKLLIEIKQLLRDRDLVCFCAPKLCHGDILIKIANE